MMTYISKIVEINFVHDQKYIYSSILSMIHIWHAFRLPLGINLNQ